MSVSKRDRKSDRGNRTYTDISWRVQGDLLRHVLGGLDGVKFGAKPGHAILRVKLPEREDIAVLLQECIDATLEELNLAGSDGTVNLREHHHLAVVERGDHRRIARLLGWKALLGDSELRLGDIADVGGRVDHGHTLVDPRCTTHVVEERIGGELLVVGLRVDDEDADDLVPVELPQVSARWMSMEVSGGVVSTYFLVERVEQVVVHALRHLDFEIVRAHELARDDIGGEEDLGTRWADAIVDSDRSWLRPVGRLLLRIRAYDEWTIIVRHAAEIEVRRWVTGWLEGGRLAVQLLRVLALVVDPGGVSSARLNVRESLTWYSRQA